MNYNAINNTINSGMNKEIIDIWKIPLSADLSQIRELYSYLNLEEISVANQIKSNVIRNKRIIARGNLRKILAFYLGIEPQEVEFEYEKNCKPNLKNTSLYFNLSHSLSYALVALSKGHPIGIDVEEIRKIDFESIASITFSFQEQSYLNSLKPSKRLEEFYKIWTLKEAYLKTLGTGFSQDPAAINVLASLGEDKGNEWVRVDNCLLHSITLLPSQIGAASVYSSISIEPLLKYHDLETEKLPSPSNFWEANVG